MSGARPSPPVFRGGRSGRRGSPARFPQAPDPASPICGTVPAQSVATVLGYPFLTSHWGLSVVDSKPIRYRCQDKSYLNSYQHKTLEDSGILADDEPWSAIRSSESVFA